MLTETLSGECPCCGYNKMLQRYGSEGYYQMDGCVRCGFGYGTNSADNEVRGVQAWIDFAKIILASSESEKYIKDFEDDKEVERFEYGYATNGKQTKEEKAFNKAIEIIEGLPESKIRKMIFDWAEKQVRSDDVESTVFKYDQEEIMSYKKQIVKERLKLFL